MRITRLRAPANIRTTTAIVAVLAAALLVTLSVAWAAGFVETAKLTASDASDSAREGGIEGGGG